MSINASREIYEGGNVGQVRFFLPSKEQESQISAFICTQRSSFGVLLSFRHHIFVTIVKE